MLGWGGQQGWERLRSSGLSPPPVSFLLTPSLTSGAWGGGGGEGVLRGVCVCGGLAPQVGAGDGGGPLEPLFPACGPAGVE